MGNWCEVPTKHLFVIELFDISRDLKKSVMRTCLVDFWSVCGKDSVWAFGRSITGLEVDFGLWEVEANLNMIMSIPIIYNPSSMSHTWKAFSSFGNMTLMNFINW